MKNFMEPQNERRPDVLFDYENHTLEFGGEAYPETHDRFYKYVLASLKGYLAEGHTEPLTFNFRVIYFNSTSARMMMRLVDHVDQVAGEGRSVTINWYYHPEDEIMEEFGEDFVDDVKHATFNMIPETDA